MQAVSMKHYKLNNYTRLYEAYQNNHIIKLFVWLLSK